MFERNKKKTAKSTKELKSNPQKRVAEKSSSRNNDKNKKNPQESAPSPKKEGGQKPVSQENVISKKERIPSHSAVLTSDDGPIPISNELKASYAAVVEDENDKLALILCDPTRPSSAQLDNDYQNLKKRCIDSGYTSVRRQKATPNIISIIYANSQQLTGSKSNKNEKNRYRNEFFDLVRNAIRCRATDIHIEIRRDTAAVRFRVDGRMVEKEDWEVVRAEKMVNMIYTVIAKEKDITFNMNEPQSAIVDEVIDNQSVRLRLNTLNAYPKGVDMVMRVLLMGMSVGEVKLETLGYSQEQLDDIDTMMSRPNGVVVVAGVTGSGKSTTNSVLLSRIIEENKDLEGCAVKIFTVEDPPEYEIAGATQVPVVRSKSKDPNENPFASTMRAVLRMDPDIILVGEVRDEESIELMKHAVQSGHHVFTTIHAQHAFAILTRMKGLGLENDVLGSQGFVSGLIYQALVKVVCSHCALTLDQAVEHEEYKGSRKLAACIERIKAINQPNKHIDNVRIRNPKGCKECNGGAVGRSVVAETVPMEEDLLDYLGRGMINEARNYHKAKGGVFVVDHAIDKVMEGLVDPLDAESKVGPLIPSSQEQDEQEKPGDQEGEDLKAHPLDNSPLIQSGRNAATTQEIE